jgi:hypothetical protein
MQFNDKSFVKSVWLVDCSIYHRSVHDFKLKQINKIFCIKMYVYM